MEMEQVIQWAGYVVAALTALISLYKSHKAGKTLAETAMILINTLKDESKMVGGQFTTATVDKAKAVAEKISADSVAVETAKNALIGKETDIKLGSYKGKPIYLSRILSLGAGVKNILK